MNLSDIKAIQIPEGVVTKIEYNNQVLWQKVTGILQMINPYGVPNANTFVNRLNGGVTAPSATGGIWRHSDYIQVEEETTYLFGMAVYATASTAGVAWYDDNQNFVSGINATTIKSENGLITSPTNAAYLRLSWRIDEGYNTDWEHQVWLCKQGVCDHWTSWLGGHVPSDYTELTYIQSTDAGQYINTDYLITSNNSSYKVHYRLAVDGASAQSITGTDVNGYIGANGNFMITWTKTNGIGFSNNGVPYVAGHIYDITHYRAINGETRYTKIDDTRLDMAASTTIYKDRPFGIFRLSPYTTEFHKIWGKIYEWQGYVDDVLTIDLVPAIDPNGVIGMWDRVGFNFLTNAGTGTFIAGPAA